MGLEIEGAMQQAPHPGRQDIVSGGDEALVPRSVIRQGSMRHCPRT